MARTAAAAADAATRHTMGKQESGATTTAAVPQPECSRHFPFILKE